MAQQALHFLCQMKMDEFALLWEQLPKDLRAVAFRAPRDVVVDVDSLPPNERVAMLLSSGTALFLCTSQALLGPPELELFERPLVLLRKPYVATPSK